MDLTFTLADLTATSACELRLYTELRERAQKQSARPAPEKLERAREAYRECLRALTAGGMVGSGVVSGEHAGGTAHPVPLVATSAAGLTYTVELDCLDCPVADSTGEGNTARIVCTPHLGEAAHRALLRGALAAHLLTASATENTENARRLDLHLEHGANEYGANEYGAGSESGPTEHTEHHSPVPQPHRVDSARILPLIRLQEQRLLLLTEALNEGVEPAELAERIPYFLTCGECPACLNAAASLALATEAPELVTEDTAEDTAENPETEEHPVMYRVPAAVENDSEQYHLQCLLDAQLASLEEHAAERGWGAGELEAAMLLSMTNYHRRERAPFWREHIRRLEDGPTAWVASRDYAYLNRVQVLSVEHAHALLNTPADLEALAAAMKEPTEVEDAPGWYRVRGAQVRLLRARIEADPSLVIAPSDRAVFCAYEAGLSPQIALDRMESQVNYFRASNPGERVPAELAATGFFGLRVLAVAQGGFGAGSVDSADPEEAAAESGKSTGESAGEFLEVLLQERIRVKDEPHRALPSGIGPGDPVSTATIEAALQSDVHGLLFGGALMPSDPVPAEDSGASSESEEAPAAPRALPSVLDAAASLTGVKSASADLLFRRAPRLKKSASNAKNAENLPREVDFSASDLPTVDAVHAAVRALDHSYVAVQGPPGAGKTFLASHVIARLVAEGAKVGVVAQSHAVIENLMVACCARDGFDVSRAVRLRGKSVTPDAPWSEVSDSELVELISGAGGLLFGGTVWDYVSERRVPAGSLDVLVVDEAGQFSLTNTVAAARAARSVLLLGDPQQLPQVSTGVHPYPVDVSALGWLSDGAAALDPRFGYFLGESWRMDSALCERVSWLSYGGALVSAAATAGRALQGVAPGVVSYPVEHAGCSVRSVQEAQAVVDCVRELLGREWVPAAGAEPRPLAAEDCIVVAAYNAQVDCVCEALIAAGLADSSGAGVRVGTVDKFQGQEAAVVLVSLASSRVDSGRGAGFVLSPNRLNVAVSRGQWQAVLVHSPWVARSVPQDVEEVLALSGFAGLVE